MLDCNLECNTGLVNSNFKFMSQPERFIYSTEKIVSLFLLLSEMLILSSTHLLIEDFRRGQCNQCMNYFWLFLLCLIWFKKTCEKKYKNLNFTPEIMLCTLILDENTPKRYNQFYIIFFLMAIRFSLVLLGSNWSIKWAQIRIFSIFCVYST